MANLYGVANAPAGVLSNQYVPGNIAIPPGVWTVFWTSPPLVAPSQGYFFPVAWANLAVLQGASISTGMQMGLQIGSGSITSLCQLPGNGWVANGTVYLPAMGAGTPSQVAWQGAGSTVSLLLESTANGVTVWTYSPILILLLRAPDQ